MLRLPDRPSFLTGEDAAAIAAATVAAIAAAVCLMIAWAGHEDVLTGLALIRSP
jgi:hypothetical protein